MKSFIDFKPEKSIEPYQKLPAGLYVGIITAVEEVGEYPEDALVLQLEILEGTWAGYYTRRFEYDKENPRIPEPRYKGTYRLWAPRPENRKLKNPGWALHTFNHAVWSIEQSNEGYTFDFENTGALVGKEVGINVRNASLNGFAFTEIGRLESVEDVRSGNAPRLPDRKERSTAGLSVYTPMDPGTEPELPF